MSAPSLARVQNLTKDYGGLRALDGVSFDLPSGEVTAVIGPNGAGKTTLLDLISGIEPSATGSIHIADEDVTDYPQWKRASLVGRVFQGVRVFPELTVEGHLTLALRRRGENDREMSVQDALAMLGKIWGEHVDPRHGVQHLPHGRSKSLAFVTALIRRPKLLLLDEPTVGVDGPSYHRMLEALREARDPERAILLVEHNLDVVREVADSVVFLAAGEVVRVGSYQEVASDPTLRRIYFGV